MSVLSLDVSCLSNFGKCHRGQFDLEPLHDTCYGKCNHSLTLAPNSVFERIPRAELTFFILEMRP